jgi:uncharacterized membrane protein
LLPNHSSREKSFAVGFAHNENLLTTLLHYRARNRRYAVSGILVSFKLVWFANAFLADKANGLRQQRFAFLHGVFHAHVRRSLRVFNRFAVFGVRRANHLFSLAYLIFQSPDIRKDKIKYLPFWYIFGIINISK